MNIKNKIQILFVVMFSFSCEIEELDCNDVAGGEAIIDECGICSGGDTGLEVNAKQSCDGQCEGDSWFWSLDDLGDGICDEGTWWVALNCEKFNCDSGDCGSWDGTKCISDSGRSAIRYEAYNAPWAPEELITDDPSIPADYVRDTFYEAIPGTYTFSYPNAEGGVWEGTYTTTQSNGVVNSNVTPNYCFELECYTYIGPSFYDISWMSSCSDYFATSTPTTARKSIKAEGEKLDDYLDKVENARQNDQTAYQKYLSEKEYRQAEENRLQDLYGITREVVNINDVIVNNKFDYDRIIEAVDTYSNVQIQEGENFILKYYKRNIIE